jgi:hypothetical protein
MTASTGVGPGGRREGAGRPFGARNKKARQLIIEAERNGLLTPVEYLLGLMRDNNMPVRERTAAAIAVAPYLHPKLSMLRITANHEQLSDEQLVAQVAQFEAIAAAMSGEECAESIDNQFQHMLEDVPKLHRTKQEAFYRRLVEAGEDGLLRLAAPVSPLSATRISDRHILTRPSET